MTKIHRDFKDIPSKKANDPNLYGHEKHVLDYDFVRTPEKRAFSRAVKKAHQSNAKQQVTHFDGKYIYIISVTPTQARCYNTIKNLPQSSEGIDWNILRKLFRYATINVLVKNNLLKVVGERVFIGTPIESDQEIMEKGGVGKISITMPA